MPTNDVFYVVGLILTDQPFMDRMHQSIEPEDFSDPLRGLVRVALNYYEEYSHRLLSRDALDAMLGGKEEEEQEELTELWTHCHAVGMEVQARPLWRERAEAWLQARWLGRALDEAKTALASGDSSGAREALQHAERPVFGTASTELTLTTGLGPVLSEPVTEDYIPTGVPKLDEVLEGGLRPSEFGILLAATNVGKSMGLALFAAAAYLADKRVLFYTSELTPAQVLVRIAAAIFKRPIKELADDAEVLNRALVEIEQTLTRADVMIRELPTNMSAMLADLDRMEEVGTQPDVIILDSADDFQPMQKHDNQYQALGEVYQQLRMVVAQQKRYAVWTSTQTNRDGVDKAKQNLKYIGDSFKKAQRAHLVVGMGQTQEELKEKWAPRIRLHVLKDTLHGCKGKGWKFNALFGRDDTPGYPGLTDDQGAFYS